MMDDIVTRRASGRLGQMLRGKWRLDKLLGVGGMACVYAATHRNGKRGAVKMLHLELSIDEDARSRFLREGYLANRVDHPGAVSVLDDDVADDGSVFLVMELLEGETVDSQAQARPGFRLPVEDVVRIGDQLLDVLAAAHDKTIVHRDLKPENLFMTRSGQLKVLDFGIARLRELESTSKATRTGTLMGTPTFMPPEQALGHWDQVDARSDLWAAAATLFTLLTGTTVHEANTLNKLLLAAMTQPARPIRKVLPSVPEPLAAVIDRALAFEPADRFQDARAMQRALREAAVVGDTPTRLAPLRSHAGALPAPSTSGEASLASTRPWVAAADRPTKNPAELGLPPLAPPIAAPTALSAGVTPPARPSPPPAPVAPTRPSGAPWPTLENTIGGGATPATTLPSTIGPSPTGFTRDRTLIGPSPARRLLPVIAGMIGTLVVAAVVVTLLLRLRGLPREETTAIADDPATPSQSSPGAEVAPTVLPTPPPATAAETAAPEPPAPAASASAPSATASAKVARPARTAPPTRTAPTTSPKPPPKKDPFENF